MPVSPEFSKVLTLLRDISQPFPPKALYHFSNLTAEDLAALEAAWPEVDANRRHAILEDLSDLSEANFEVSFEDVFRFALEDETPEARVAALEGLWEAEAPDLMGRYLHLLLHDPAVDVRAAAANALGRFVLLGEDNKISPAHALRIEAALLAVYHGTDDLEVRRRALEALAYSSRPEVTALIRTAYTSPETKLRISAIFAMGRSADEQWTADIITELESVTPEIRFEAARAAGELEIEDAVPVLLRLGEDSDRQVREAAIWSLSQVGGDEARKALKRLERQAETDETEFIHDALDNLDFTDEVHAFSLFDFDFADTPEDESDEV